MAIFQTVKSGFSFLQSQVLLLHKLFLLVDVLLDLFKKQMDGLSLVVSDFVELVDKAINVFRWVDLDKVLLALVMKIVELSFTFFARFDLLGVWQRMWRLLFVQIKELSLANLSKGVHDVPMVILRNSKLIQLH
jgi:hypothetical protein